MARIALRLSLALMPAFLLLTPAPAAGQSMTGRLAGVVRDAQDAIVPGAAVNVRNEQTGAVFEVVSSDAGTWMIPAVQNGTYTITVSLPGFKSTVVTGVKVDTGATATVNARLEVGGITEQVTVTSGASVLQTESANVSSTIVGRQISELPFTTRDAMQLILTLPGVQTPGTPRTSSVNGLPKSGLNIMLDGANIQDNYLKSSDGFFTSVQAKSDAVEEVTISTATPGAESAGGGAVQIKFVTKSGSNDLHGGVFWQHRNDALNANYYMNTISGLPRDRIILNQLGGRLGGPISIPGLFSGRDRAFFFVNYEEFRLPQTYGASRTVLTGDARNGIFTYRDSGGTVRTVDLYKIAGAGGFPSTADPRISKGLGLIADAQQGGVVTSRVGTVNDYNRLDLAFQDPGRNIRRFPTGRLDFNLTKNHHLEFVHNYQHYFSLPDGVNSILSQYPGIGTHVGSPSIYGGSIYRNAFSFVMAERWTVTPRIVNEVRLTSSGNGTSVFRREFTPKAYALFDGNWVSDPFTSGFFRYSGASRRHTPVKTIDENLNWQKGRHAFNFGASLVRIDSFTESVSSAIVPQISLGIATNDPVNTGSTSLFTTRNFPGSTPTQRTQAGQLYALLTGRVSSTARAATLGEKTRKYEYLPNVQRNHQREFGFYVQDSWKARPNLTLTGGLRWEIDLSPLNDNNVYTRTGVDGIWGVSGVGNLFKPGVYTGGVVTQYSLVREGERGYRTNYKDFAPSAGFAWSPSFGGGLLQRLFGDGGKTVLRGGYSIAYVREGFDAFNSMFGSNEGVSVALGTNPGNFPAEFGRPGSRLLRDPSLPFLSIPEAKFPFTARQGASLNDFRPNLRPGYVQSWTFGLQRELSRDLALEVRYVANHGTRMWRQYELGEVNIFENGFLDEFGIAAENLRIARLGNPSSNNFGNQGLPGQKSIPIISTALNTNDQNFATTISRGEAGRLAANIAQNLSRMNALINAGVVSSMSLADPNDPGATIRLSNHFVANPRSPTNSWIMDNGADGNYHALQVELRRRMSRGLLTQGSYTWAKSLTNTFASSSAAALTPTTLRDFGHDKGPAPRDIRHALKVDWIHELPFGPGRRYLSGGNAFVRRFLEGWQWSGVARIQSGSPFLLEGGRLTYNNRESGVVLHNMTRDQMQSMIKIRKDSVCTSGNCRGVIYWLPQPVIDNTLAAFETGGKTLADLDPNAPYIGPPTTAGRLGARVFVYGPWISRYDLALLKRTRITEGTNVELRVQFLNAFNQSNITIQAPGTNAAESNGIGAAFGQTTNAYRDFTVSGTNDPGGRLIEFQLRINF